MSDAWLEVYDDAGSVGARPGRRVDLSVERGECTLGRGAGCDVVLLLEAVSRRHARLVAEGPVWFVEDLGSRNGTAINDRLLEGRHELRDGDEIRVGTGLVRVHLPRAVGGTAEVGAAEGGGAGGGASAAGQPAAAAAATATIDVAAGDEQPDILSTLQVAGRDQAPEASRALDPERALSAVLAINAQLGGSLDLDEVLAKMLEHLFAVYPQADCGVVLLDRDQVRGVDAPADPDPEAEVSLDDLEVRAVRNRRAAPDGRVRISRTILEVALQRREAVLSRDASVDRSFEMSMSLMDLPIRSVMCVPLLGRPAGGGEDGRAPVLGLLQIHTEDSSQPFGEEALRVLVSVAQAAAIAIDNAVLHGRVLRQERIERDLDIARRVQRSFLPVGTPQLEGYRFATWYEPAYTVGGDIYTYVPLEGGRFGCLVGDVSGKGISAALLMARITGDARFAMWVAPDPSDVLARLDRGLHEGGLDDRFVTGVVLVLDPAAQAVDVANAGHPAPLCYRARTGTVEPVGEDAVGLPLGVLEPGTGSWPTTRVELAPGDAVLAWTDGVDETRSPSGELMGRAVVAETLAAVRGHPERFSEAIRERMASFSRGAPRRDDTTFVMVQRA